MLFKRSSLVDMIKSTIRLISIAQTKTHMAYSMALKTRVGGRVVSETRVIATMAGLPVLPEFIAGTYISSTISDIKKARKTLAKIRDKLKREYSSDGEYLNELLENAISKLQQLENSIKSGQNPMDTVRELDEVKELLNNLLTLLEGYSNT